MTSFVDWKFVLNGVQDVGVWRWGERKGRVGEWV